MLISSITVDDIVSLWLTVPFYFGRFTDVQGWRKDLKVFLMDKQLRSQHIIVSDIY